MESSIFTAEACTIDLALDIISKEKHKKLIIFSDALSVLLSLNNKKTRAPTYYQTNLQTTLIIRQRNRFFTGYQGTLGWEEIIEQTRQQNWLLTWPREVQHPIHWSETQNK